MWLFDWPINKPTNWSDSSIGMRNKGKKEYRSHKRSLGERADKYAKIIRFANSTINRTIYWHAHGRPNHRLPFQIHPKSFENSSQNPSKNLPKSFQNCPRTLPEPSQNPPSKLHALKNWFFFNFWRAQGLPQSSQNS